MRPVTKRLSAAGVSPWILLDWRQVGFEVGLVVKLSSGASMTFDVEHTFDDLYAIATAFSISRTTTVATVTYTNHGLSVNDYVRCLNCGAPFDIEAVVASVADANTFTFAVANSGATAVALNAGQMITARVMKHDVLASKTASDDGNYAFPPIATRLNITTYGSGTADFTVIQSGP